MRQTINRYQNKPVFSESIHVKQRSCSTGFSHLLCDVSHLFITLTKITSSGKIIQTSLCHPKPQHIESIDFICC